MWVNENIKPKPEFKLGRDKKYNVKAINDSIVYANEVDSQLLKSYYLIS